MKLKVTRGPNHGTADVRARIGVWEWVVYSDGTGAKRAASRHSHIARRFANLAETEADAATYQRIVQNW